MGLTHDRFGTCNGTCQASSSNVPFAYSSGYVNQRAFDPNDPSSRNPDPTVPRTARWLTVMAYDTQCRAAGIRCEWLPRFSNPDQIHPDPGGDPLGTAGLQPSSALDGPSDAVRMLNRTRGYVANFRSPQELAVSFGAGPYTAAEGGAAATVAVRLSEAPGRQIAIPLAATGANGAAVEDYTVPHSVVFEANDTEQTVTVMAVDDGVDDDGETVNLTLGDRLPGGVSAGSPASATVMLTDNDTVTGAPRIQSVSLSAYSKRHISAGLVGYRVGRWVSATVRFDKEVGLTGRPRLGLTVGSVKRQASFTGAEREVLRFRYIVADGDADADAISIPANALTLNGGTIRDGANQDAILVHGALADDPNHRVDGVSPTLLAAEVDGTELTLTFDEALLDSSIPEEALLAAENTFFVDVDDDRVFAERVWVFGDTVTVTLDREVLTGQTVTVRYQDGQRWRIRDRAGNTAAEFDQQAKNVSRVSAVYDTDGDALIEITTLAQLDAIRHDLDGDGVPTTSGTDAYRAAFPDAYSEEAGGRLVCARKRRGYELMTGLDSDGDGEVDSDDDYWNDSAGWDPIGPRFEATFEGNGHIIRHLFIDRPSRRYPTGLFRQPGKDIATEPAPVGLWSDGETLWVAGLGGGLRAHRLADGTRQAWRDLALEANTAPAGVWSDGETAWVADWLGDTVHAYRLSDGRRVAGRDIRLAGGNLLPVGLWSDGQTLWVADWRERFYAYRLSDGRSRSPAGHPGGHP